MRSIKKHSAVGIIRGSASRNLAVLIALCYMLQPLHGPIKLAMHSFSHFVEKPAHLITHNEASTAGTLNYHEYHEHQYYQVNHQHGLIDFLDALLSGEDMDQSHDQTIVEIQKVDKHNIVDTLNWEKTSLSSVIAITKEFSTETNSGYLQELLRPPVFV